MKLFEFQGRRIFEEYGLRVPAPTLFTSPTGLDGIRFPAVLKAQVLTGGRGKAGGVKIVSDKASLEAAMQSLFSMTIKGEAVKCVLVQDAVTILRELYLSIAFKAGSPVLIACGSGGVDIEQTAKENPERIITMPIDPFTGPTGYQARALAKQMGYADFADLGRVISGLYRAFKACDATLMEINPLAVTPDGLMALDAKVVLDDKAEFRHKELFQLLRSEQFEELSPVTDTITFVPLDGDLGLISDGAGTGMLTLDLIKDAGGSPASFCELGGITNEQTMHRAMELTMENPALKKLLVVLIGGFNRMDDMARGIKLYMEEHKLTVPVVVRMCGTMQEEGKRIMAEVGIETEDDLSTAVNKIVSAVGGA